MGIEKLTPSSVQQWEGTGRWLNGDRGAMKNSEWRIHTDPIGDPKYAISKTTGPGDDHSHNFIKTLCYSQIRNQLETRKRLDCI